LKGFWPKGLTDCLNFGNPEKIEIMSEFVASVEALVDCSLAMEAPVVSGNVSFYNETLGQNIISTPAIGVVGLRESIDGLPEDRFLQAGSRVYRISLSQVFTRFGCELGFSGELAIDATVKWMRSLQTLSFAKGVLANQMVSQGGVALSLLKMCRRGIGFQLQAPLSLTDLVQDVLYQSLWVVDSTEQSSFEELAEKLQLRPEFLGLTQELKFEIPGRVSMDVNEWRSEDKMALRRAIESLA
jgi:phosphoribosylformylglycinamidine synthase